MKHMIAIQNEMNHSYNHSMKTIQMNQISPAPTHCQPRWASPKAASALPGRNQVLASSALSEKGREYSNASEAQTLWMNWSWRIMKLINYGDW